MQAEAKTTTKGLSGVHWIVATGIGAAAYVGVEWSWLLKSAEENSGSVWTMALLAEVGFALMCVGACTGLWWILARLFQLLGRGRALLAGAAVALLCSPYFFEISRFTLSGPQVRDLAAQPVLVGALFLGLLFGAGVLSWMVFWRLTRAVSKLGGLLVLAFGCALLWGNGAVLPNEYEPLHRFVSLASLTLLSLGALELARSVVKVSFKFVLGALIVYVALVLGSQFALAKSNAVRWVVFGESVASRYLIFDFSNEEEEGAPSLGAATDSTSEKPVLVNDQAARRAREKRRRGQAPHIIVFSVDNLQRDRVGANGYRDNPTTPNIDRLAKRGANFQRAYTHYPGTRVFLSSMLTGRRLPSFDSHRMPARFVSTSLTRLLKQRDYHVLVKGVFELTSQRDFDPDDYQIDTNLRRASSDEIRASRTIPHIPLDERFALLEKHVGEAKDEEKPVFVWVHWLKPHRFGGRFVGAREFGFKRGLDGLYDASVAATDALIPRIEKLLKDELNDGRDVVWVIQSDHGAGMTRGPKKEVGKTLYEDQVNVPLVIAGPGILPSKPEVLVDSSLDVSATVLDLVGIEPPEDYDGVSLMPVLQGTVDESAFEDRLIALRSGSWTGAVYRDHKLIVRSNHASLFDLGADPNERHNIADNKPKMLKKMKRRAKLELKRSKQLYEAGVAAL